MFQTCAIRQLLLLFALLTGASAHCLSQEHPDLRAYFKDYVELTDDQISAIRSGQAVARACTPALLMRSLCLARSRLMLRLKLISNSCVISIAYANFRDTWQ